MGVAPTTPEPLLSPAAASKLVDSDAPCAKCGYNLRTLPTDGYCPECACPVVDSLRGPLAWPSSLAAVRRALRLWIAAVAVCTLVMVLLWLYLRYWYPLSMTYPLLSRRTLSRGVISTLFTLDLFGGLARMASVVLLLLAIRPVCRALAWFLSAALGLVMLSTLFLAAAEFWPRLLAQWTRSDWHEHYLAHAPLVVWLGVAVAWSRLSWSVYASRSPAMKRAATCGATLAVLMLASGGAYTWVSWSGSPQWSDHPLWTYRTLAWTGNGAIERLGDVALLVAALVIIRGGHSPSARAAESAHAPGQSQPNVPAVTRL